MSAVSDGQRRSRRHGSPTKRRQTLYSVWMTKPFSLAVLHSIAPQLCSRRQQVRAYLDAASEAVGSAAAGAVRRGARDSVQKVLNERRDGRLIICELLRERRERCAHGLLHGLAGGREDVLQDCNNSRNFGVVGGEVLRHGAEEDDCTRAHLHRTAQHQSSSTGVSIPQPASCAQRPATHLLNRRQRTVAMRSSLSDLEVREDVDPSMGYSIPLTGASPADAGWTKERTNNGRMRPCECLGCAASR